MQFSVLLSPTPEELKAVQDNQPFYEFSGRKRRVVYEGVTYLPEEQNSLRQFKAFLGQSYQKSDALLLRYLYSTDFNFVSAKDRLVCLDEWNNCKQIQQMSEKVRAIINDGCIYQYGRDIKARPIVVFNLSKIDFELYVIEDYFGAIKQVLSVVEAMFIRGKLETFLFIIDVDSRSFTSLNRDAISKIIDKLGTVYSMRLGKMLIVNTSTIFSLAFRAIRPFIAEETSAKIELLTTSEVAEKRVLEFVKPHELQFKYGGSRSNLTMHWPPRRPADMHNHFMETGSEYFSVGNTYADFFEFQNKQEHESCCQSQCFIF